MQPKLAYPIDECVPGLTTSVESAISMTIPVDIISAKQPGTRLVLVADWKTVVEPVRDVRVPEKETVQVDINVLKAGGVHDTVDVVCLVSKDDFSPRRAFVVAASFKGFRDGGSGVTTVWAWLNDAYTFGDDDGRL